MLFSIRFEQDKVSEVSVSLELKSEKKVVQKKKAEKKKLKPVVPVTQAEISIVMEKPNAKRKSLLEKHQANMLKDKIIPALIGELEAKGIKNNPKAKWKLCLTISLKEATLVI